MKIIHALEFQNSSKEEKLPYSTPDFPYIATLADLDKYRESFIPWHWHNAIELFYMESGELRYNTPHKSMVFPAGSAGMVNANVLHRTQFQKQSVPNRQLLHIFDPRILSGARGSLIDKRYVSPIVTATNIEIVALFPDEPQQAETIDMIRKLFSLPETEFGYEIKIREALSKIWLNLFQLCTPVLDEKAYCADEATDKVKRMMMYVHEHFEEKISISDLASSVFVSERECYRLFQSSLHTTPNEYIRSYRMQIACQMLAESSFPVTEIGFACGIGNSSYFGKVFRESTGFTPRQYRQRWQNTNIN